MIHCENVGQLRAALADLSDDAPLRIEYDGGCGGASSIAMIGPAIEDSEPWDAWSRTGDVLLSIDYDLERCDNVTAETTHCSRCALRCRTYLWKDTGEVIKSDLDEGFVRHHVAGRPSRVCPGAGKLPR